MQDLKLSEIPYSRPIKEEVINALKELKENLEKASSLNDTLNVLDKYCSYSIDLQTNMVLAQIRFTLNTKDEFNVKENDFWDEFSPVLSFYDDEIKKVIVKSPYRKDLENILGENAFKTLDLKVSVSDERLIPLKQEEAKIVSEYVKLMSSITLTYNNETLTPSQVAKYGTNLDRNLRKGAYEALGNKYLEYKDQLDDLYDKLVNVRTRQGKILGYENFSKLGYANMQRTCYDSNDIANFRNNVKKYIVPLVKKIKENIKDELNLDRIAFYDDSIYSTKETAPYGSTNDKFDAAQKMYDSMNTETSKLFRHMREIEVFDVEAKDGKWGGGYETGIPKYKTPFILANFNGSADDVATFTHEFGHALNEHFNLQNKYYALYSLSMETAECHSMSMEFLTFPWMDLFFKDRTDDFKKMHISSSLAFIPYGVIVDAFQQYVYDNPSISKQDRIDYWKKLEADFLPYMDNTNIPFYGDGRRWQRQMHIYESPFYYIDYCLAQFTAFQFLAESLKDYNKALEKYLTFSKLGPTKSYVDLIKLSGLKSPFDEDSFKEVVDSISKILDL